MFLIRSFLTARKPSREYGGLKEKGSEVLGKGPEPSK